MTEPRNYKDTIFLPKTTFSLQGVADEAAIRAHFAEDYRGMSTPNSSPTFVLHDGPPYANGNIHMGHALNKILKDFVVRSRWAMDTGAVQYVPGWDCHGLPIEWQVEKDLMAQGKSKSDFSAPEFRQLCRDYAAGWVNTQREQFKSLGVLGDWDRPYLTMDFESEARIAKMLHTFMMSDMLYQGVKPVLWSTVEETALAEAEVEHEDLRVTSVYVAYPFSQKHNDGWMDRTSILIWTTTPWTLPGSYAIAFNPDISYGIYEVDGHTNLAKCQIGDRFVLADKLAPQVLSDIFVTEHHRVEDAQPQFYITGHPLRSEAWDGYKWGVPCLPGAHVTDDVGTGFVHTAPDHGPEDFACWNANNMGEFEPVVGADGRYLPHVSLFAGESILGQTPKGDYIFEFTNAKVLAKLEEAGTLVASNKVVISYPHSWRSKAPLIYRTTPQWFLSMDSLEDIRVRAVSEIDKTEFVPESGKNRLRGAVERRPDWLVSRQRVWGTPLAIFVHKETGKPLRSDALNAKIYSIFRGHGGDAWWKYDKEFWLKDSGYNPDDYDMVMDVLDVWFDSGCSHTLIDWPPGSNEQVADLYLEGSDQARGWFGSSLLVSTAMTDHAPFKAVLTHGFVLDKNGKKMSKSAGNVVDPLVEAPKYGTDVLRLWVALGDYTQDTRVGDQILKTTADIYKRLRNSLRFLVSNLQGFGDHEDDCFDDVYQYPPLERYMLNLLTELDPQIRQAYTEYRFNDVCKLLLDFCANDLSAFYFDIRKDSLYCDRHDSKRRLACRATLFRILDSLTAWLAPILPYTIAEVGEHLNMPALVVGKFPENAFLAPITTDEGPRWAKVREVLAAVTPALEEKRQAKEIGSALDANVLVFVPKDLFEAFDGVNAADVFRTSQATIMLAEAPHGQVFSVVVTPAEGKKCARSRKITKDVGSNPRYPDLSARDADAVAFLDYGINGAFE